MLLGEGIGGALLSFSRTVTERKLLGMLRSEAREEKSLLGT